MGQGMHRGEGFRRRRLGWILVILPFVLALRAGAAGPDAEVLSPGVAVRQHPSSTAPVVAELPGGARVEVLLTQRGPGGEWAHIALLSGAAGFVPNHTLRYLTQSPRWRSLDTGSGAPSLARRVGKDALEIPLRRAGGTFLVPARVNGQVTTSFVVDTGASTVMITRALADKLGIDYANNPKIGFITASGFMLSPRIVLEWIHLPDESGAGVARVEAVVATLPGFPPGIGGLLGQSFLRHFRVTIDAERRTMQLEPIVVGGTGTLLRPTD